MNQQEHLQRRFVQYIQLLKHHNPEAWEKLWSSSGLERMILPNGHFLTLEAILENYANEEGKGNRSLATIQEPKIEILSFQPDTAIAQAIYGMLVKQKKGQAKTETMVETQIWQMDPKENTWKLFYVHQSIQENTDHLAYNELQSERLDIMLKWFYEQKGEPFPAFRSLQEKRDALDHEMAAFDSSVILPESFMKAHDAYFLEEKKHHPVTLSSYICLPQDVFGATSSDGSLIAADGLLSFITSNNGYDPILSRQAGIDFQKSVWNQMNPASILDDDSNARLDDLAKKNINTKTMEKHVQEGNGSQNSSPEYEEPESRSLVDSMKQEHGENHLAFLEGGRLPVKAAAIIKIPEHYGLFTPMKQERLKKQIREALEKLNSKKTKTLLVLPGWRSLGLIPSRQGMNLLMELLEEEIDNPDSSLQQAIFITNRQDLRKAYASVLMEKASTLTAAKEQGEQE